MQEVLIVGGGLAGLAAATALVERGVRVRVVERENFLGGRAGSWSDRLADGTPFQMERGFHGFFRQYENLRALVRRVDPTLSCLAPLDDYPLLGPGGSAQSFSGLPTTPVLNILELVRRSPAIRFRDLLGADLIRAGSMLAFDPERTYAALDHVTAASYLDGLRFPAEARRMLFDVFAHSFFNPEADYSAAELCAMFHYYFTRNPKGLVFDVAREPFGPAIFQPLERWLRERGAAIELETSVISVERRDGAFVVRTERGDRRAEHRASAVILAAHVPGLRAIARASEALAAARAGIETLDVTAPFAVWRMWLDRPLREDRAPFAGTAGLGVLDNVSLYERFEGESRRWAERTGGSVVELHAYGLPAAMTEAEIREDLRRGFFEAYPEARPATVIEERFLLRQDCPAFRPGSHAARPTIHSGVEGVYLAGDFVKLPFPSALMERATSSGFLAANEILARRGLGRVPVVHGPLRGVMPAALAAP